MDGVDISDFGRTDDSGDVQVALPKLRRADADGFVGKPDRQRIAVGLAVDRHRADSELFAGADDTKGNFASIGDEYLLEHAYSEILAGVAAELTSDSTRYRHKN